MDYIYGIFKVGDLEGKETMRDGALITYIDPDVWNPVISDHMKKVFSIIKLNKSVWLDKCKSSIQPVEDSDGNLLHERAFAIDFDEIETELKLDSYTSRLRSGEVQEIIDGTKLSNSFLKDVTGIRKRGLFDLNAVSSGSFTVGSGGSYTTWALASADIASLTGNLTFTQKSDITDTASFSTFAQDVSTHTLTLTSNSKPNGDPTGGHKWIAGLGLGSSAFHFRLRTSSSGIVDVNGLHLVMTSAATTSEGIKIENTFATTGIIRVRDCILNGEGVCNRGLDLRDDTSILDIWNNKVFNFRGLSTGRGIVVVTDALHANSRIENNSVDNCNHGIDLNNLSGTLNNNVSINNGTDFRSIGSATGNNNASEDTTSGNGNWSTGVNNNISITPSNEFVSLVDTVSTYLKVKSGGVCATGGKTPDISLNTKGSRGNNRPGSDSFVSIGEDELFIPPPDLIFKKSITSKLEVSNKSVTAKLSNTSKSATGQVLTNKSITSKTTFEQG